jgi:5'(3')-deoxyribonucleotidase
MTRQLFLDCDGVLANFDEAAQRILGEHPRGYEARHSEHEFWSRLEDHTAGFYRTLDVLPQGRILFEAVRHLHPIILTGCPKGDWAAPQKKEWANEHFPGTKVITCRSVDKRLHMKRGDILVDDYLKYRKLWIDAGGIFVHYDNESPDSAAKTLAELARLGLDVKQSPALFSRQTRHSIEPPVQLSLEQHS